MNIAFFSDVFLPSVNGVVTVVKTSAWGLSELGHNVGIFYPQQKSGEEITWTRPRVSLFPVPSLPSLFYPDLRLATPTPMSLVQLKNFAPDIIHVQAPGIVGLEGLVGGKLLKVPVVGSFHTYFMEPEYLKVVKLSRFGSVTKALWNVTIKFYNQCEKVFVHSQFMADDLVSHGLNQEKIAFMPNALDFTAIETVSKKTVDAYRKKYKLGDRVILYVGRLSKEKNLDILVQAFAKVLEKIPESQLLIIGDGPVREELDGLIDSLGIGSSVIRTGSVPHDQLVRLGAFQAVSLFCTPSTTETQCMSALEAMAAGLPIIAMAAMGMLDLVKNNGVLVPPHDIKKLAAVLVEFLTNKKKATTASRESLKIAKQHSLLIAMKQHEDLYKSLIS